MCVKECVCQCGGRLDLCEECVRGDGDVCGECAQVKCVHRYAMNI